MGVKRGPTVRRMTYRYVNVGNAMIGLLKTELAAAEVIITWRSTRSSPSRRKSGTWRRGAVTMDAGKEGRANMYARYDRTRPCAPLLSLGKRWATIVMESCVMRKDHAQFGERDRETRLLQSWKVRSVPTPRSPVIANLALDGLEAKLREKYPKASNASRKAKANLVRFADDFIITGSSKEVLEKEIQPLVEQFMKERGLELSQEKTHITHITTGFDFLGQNIRKYQDGKVLVKPSKKNVKTFLAKTRKLIKENAQATAGNLIVQLNPKIRGWANYHRHVSSKQTFVKVDDAIFRALWQWAKRRHPKKPGRWVKDKYFHTIGQRNWVFCGEVEEQDGTTRNVQLFYAHTVPIERHPKIKGDANPYDPTWEMYFEERLGVKMVQNLKGKRQLISLWKEQNGLCPICHQKITKLTGWNNHHIERRVDGGADRRENRVLLHPNCHRQVHSQGLSVVKPRPVKGR